MQPIEARDLIRQLEGTGFTDLRTAARKRQEQLYSQETYKAELAASLAPEFDTRIPLSSSRTSAAAFETQAILRRQLQFHVEPGSNLKRDQAKADKIELAFAHMWAMTFDRGGRLMAGTHRYQTVGPVACWWLSYDPFALPKEEEKRADYRRTYAPFKLNLFDPLTALFLCDDDGKPTIGGREYNLTYAEIIHRYGDTSKDTNPLTICQEQFPFLRGGRSSSPEASELSSRQAKVCIVDDGVTQTHWVEIKGRSTAYEQVGKDYPNPFGRVPLFLITGRYNPDAERLVDRYQGLIVDLAQQQRNVDVVGTHIASIALTPSKWAISPSAQARAATEVVGDRTMPAPEFNDDGFATVGGDINEIRTPIPAEVKDLWAHLLTERDAILPAQFLTHPDPALLKGTVGHAHLTAVQTAQQAYDDALESVVAAVTDVFSCVEHFICKGDQHGQPGFKGEGIYINLNGREPAVKQSGHNRDSLILTAADFDIEPVLELSPLPKTASEKTLRYEEKKVQVIDGVQTPEDLIAVVTEDVSGTVEKLEEWRRYQKQGPIIDNLDFVAALEEIHLKYGRNYFALAGVGGQLMSNQEPAMPQQNVNNGSQPGSQYAPPPIPSTDMEVLS